MWCLTTGLEHKAFNGRYAMKPLTFKTKRPSGDGYGLK